ncbi:MAG: hypothetical protein VX347_03985 [Bacteroidota bacterium]|nr:hypothetical protein [Bacteroidota bacterium]
MIEWRKYNNALIPDQPPHVESYVDEKFLHQKIKEENVYFARWTSNFDCKRETNFWYIICDKFTPLENLSLNTRSKIKRGLKKCIVRNISRQELITQGYLTYYKAFDRYNTFQKPDDKKKFIKNINSLSNNWDFWGVFFKDRLVGYSLNLVKDNSCDYSIIKFHPDYLKYYSSYCLFYSMNKFYLDEQKFKYVNDGARSISHDTDIQGYLISKFNFRKAYCKLHIIYSQRIAFFISFIYFFRNIFLKFENSFLIKVNTLIRQEIIRKEHVPNWRIYNGAIIPKIPPHLNIVDSLDIIKKMIQNSGVYFARWTSDFDCKKETEFWYIIKDNFNGIEEYSASTRKSIRKGLKNVNVSMISKNKLIKSGYEVYYKAFERYKTHSLIKSELEFRNEIIGFDSSWDIWGVFTKEGKMIGFSQNKIEEEYCNFSTTKFHPDYLKLRTSDVLFYLMTDYYLNNLNLKYVTGGTRSMSHDTNIQKEYIRKFKYRRAYCKLNVIYSPIIKVLVNCIFPIRDIFYIFNTKLTSKIQTLIEHEKIRRSYGK